MIIPEGMTCTDHAVLLEPLLLHRSEAAGRVLEGGGWAVGGLKRVTNLHSSPYCSMRSLDLYEYEEARCTGGEVFDFFFWRRKQTS